MEKIKVYFMGVSTNICWASFIFTDIQGKYRSGRREKDEEIVAENRSTNNMCRCDT